jgi:hypothetical protein
MRCHARRVPAETQPIAPGDGEQLDEVTAAGIDSADAHHPVSAN